MKTNHANLLIDDRVAIGAFDFDGNILAPDTITYVIDREAGEEVGIVAHELDKHPEWISGENAKYRWHEDITQSVRFFRDFYSDPEHQGPDELKNDVEKALREKKLSPSISDLIHTFLVPARIFAIITARGHSPDNIIRALWIISEGLLDPEQKETQYRNIQNLHSHLKKNEKLKSRDEALRFYFQHIVGIYPVSNESVARYLSMTHELSMAKRKTLALKHYIQEVSARILSPLKLDQFPYALGFSDDSVSNIRAMIDFFLEEKRKGNFQKDKIRLYFTGKESDYAIFNTLDFVSTEIDGEKLVIRFE